MKKAAFLDRDGVINAAIVLNGKPDSPKNLTEMKILEGVIEAIQTLKAQSFIPIIITNQPDIARNRLKDVDLIAMHEKIRSETQIEYFYTCPHDDEDGCNCRKPKPGLISQAEKDLQIELKSSFLVGDRWRDITTAQALGIEAFFIDYSYTEKQPSKPYTRVSSLLEVSKIMVQRSKNDITN